MTPRAGTRVLLIAVLGAAFTSVAADIVLTPPAGGGVAVTNSAGDTNRFRVADDGSATLSGSLTLGGNLVVTGGKIDIPISTTPLQGIITKGGSPFIHNFGTSSTFLGLAAGDMAMSGSGNTGMGHAALTLLDTGTNNSAVGQAALSRTATANNNTAVGYFALRLNIANSNTAVGSQALDSNTGGASNTALGTGALNGNTTGTNNVGVGSGAGSLYTTGNFNIAIAHVGVAGESSTTRIGSFQTRAFIAGINGATIAVAASPVLIDASGQLGTMNSSRRVKERIADMDAASEALMRLRPVTFQYTAHGPGGLLQYGLVAEEVAEVYPGLVMHDADGKVQTVMYQYLPPMLLNEYQKQQRTIELQHRAIRGQARRIAELEQKTEWLIRTLEGLAAGGAIPKTASQP